MKKELPAIRFDKESNLNIEVMNFEQLFSKLIQINRHDPFAPHKIEFYLILLVTQNSYSHFVDFKSYKVGVGSSLFVTKNQVHHFNKELQHAEGFGIVFNHLFVDAHYLLHDNLRLNRLFNYHIESPVIHRQDTREERLGELIQNLYKEYNSPDDFAKSEILASLLRVLLLKAERAKELRTPLQIKPQWLDTFTKFKDLLENEYINSRNSKEYASRLFVSYKFLNDVVKKLTGKTVKTFIDDFVTIEIKRYLISTSLSVNEISYKTGFEEPSNMVKFFKKNTQTTPMAFRHNI